MSDTATILVEDTPQNRTRWDVHPTAHVAPFYIGLAPEESLKYGGARRVLVLFASTAERKL